MCIRLYPDVIIAAEINNRYSIGSDNCVISIPDCLSHQRDYTRFGFCHAFVGYGDEDWSASDYESYMRSLPKYFQKQGDDIYKVDMKALVGSGSGNRGRRICEELLTQGTYSIKALNSLGFEIV